MKKFLFLLIASTITLHGLDAQQKKDVLLTLDGKPIYADEFSRVYKKNLDLVQEENQKSVSGYLDLFVDYKLKVAEAYVQNLDEKDSYLKDFSKYEEQLSRNYIYENQISDKIIREAYDRSLEEIDVSHILILVNHDAVAQDTLIAYNKMKAIHERALSGEDFTELARTTSEEPGADQKKGRLGYFTAFTMVYPFENVAYNMEVGEISDIVRTQFGYHIIKLHDRRKKDPPISVSHIMVSSQNDSLSEIAKGRIDEIYALIQQGESYEDLARQYSDDKATGRNGGKMRKFSKGDLKAPPFENAAYALKKSGDISEPIQTRFGWHIIKLNELHEMKSYEDSYVELERRVRGGDRAKVITSTVNKQLKEIQNFRLAEGNEEFLLANVSEDILERKWEYTPAEGVSDRVLFTVEEKGYTFDDFAKYAEKRHKSIRPHQQKISILKLLFDEFETKSLKEYFRANLEKQNEEYATIINEYRDGLLIFEVMSDNVWTKAKNDTLGMESFFNARRGDYQWKERAKIESFATSDESMLKEVTRLWKEGKTSEEIKKELNSGGKVNVILTEGTFEDGDKELPAGFEFKTGISNTYSVNNSAMIVRVLEVMPAGPKELEDVKGRVLSDYQNHLENEWMKTLRDKYEVSINKKTLKRLKKKLES